MLKNHLNISQLYENFMAHYRHHKLEEYHIVPIFHFSQTHGFSRCKRIEIMFHISVKQNKTKNWTLDQSIGFPLFKI